jgi:hypothetical protein
MREHNNLGGLSDAKRFMVHDRSMIGDYLKTAAEGKQYPAL